MMVWLYITTVCSQIFLIICDRIDADTLVRSLMYVNKQFYAVISDTYLWRKRILRKFNDCDVAFMMTDAYNGEAKWPLLYVGIENKFWSFLFRSHREYI